MNEILGGAIGVVLSVFITFLVTWGMVRGKLGELERRIEIEELETKEINSKVNGLHDVYVSQQHFNEIMGTIRETQKELRDDMKKILGFVSRGEL